MIRPDVAGHLVDILYARSEHPTEDGRWHFAYATPDNAFSVATFEDKAEAALFKLFWWDSVYWLRGPDGGERGGRAI